MQRALLCVAHPAIVRSHSHVVVAHLPIAAHLFSFWDTVEAHIKGGKDTATCFLGCEKVRSYENRVN